MLTFLALRPRLRLGALLLIATAAVLALGASPVKAWDNSFHFFSFPFFDRRPQQMWPWQQQQQQQQPQPEPRQQIDYSKAPPAKKSDTSATTHIVVMGDAMADWLAYGLEDAFSESPEIGVVRKHRTYSGLIHGDSKNAYDWPQAARDILSNEKADYIVMMIGMSDRQSIREKQVRGGPAKPGTAASGPRPGPGDSTGHDEEAQPTPEEPAASAAPEPTTRVGGTSTYEFRSEPWAERYSKRIDEMITVLKSKGVPVFWVGVPALRGTRSSADMAYLNNLYRGRAEKAGITFVDVWDGFVDENGNFTTHGPDFEGQTRRLRSADGVYFTKAGAQKLAHYVEREIQHAMLTRNSPVAALAPEEPVPQASARQGAQPARPVAGPVVPLTTISGTQEELLGGPARTPAIDASATKVLVKGEPPASLAGRADDFAWPKPDATPAPPVRSEAPTSPPPPAAKNGPPDRSSPSKSAASPKPPRSEPPAHTPKRVQHPAAAQAAPPRVTTQAAPVGDDTLRPPGLIPPR
jgi:uncharacterized protein